MIPDRLQDGTDRLIGQLLSGEGNWELNGDTGKQNVELRINYDEGSKLWGPIKRGITNGLRVEQNENGIELRFWYDDKEKEFVFLRSAGS